MIYNIIFIYILIVLVVVCDYLLLGLRKGRSFEQWHSDMLKNNREFMLALLFLTGLFAGIIIIGLLAIMLIPILLIAIEFIVWGGNLIEQVLSYWI